MRFYEVAIASPKYHGSTPLTYISQVVVPEGTIVKVSLKNNLVLGVVIRPTKQHLKIKLKEIDDSQTGLRLPSTQLQLLRWLSSYYPAPLGVITQLFLPNQIIEPSPTEKLTIQPQPLPPLTQEQKISLDQLSSQSGAVLLHGDTGTGKTRVYLELARRAIDKGQSAIILVPEIGLTPQMETVFNEQFSGQVTTFHSGLTPKQRREAWSKIHNNPGPQIVIGPRSALFTPVNKLGLIVVDEAHDNGYKQDQLPYYETTRVAAKLAALANCLCVYGTATPKVADYWQLDKHKRPIIRIQQLVHPDVKLPTIEIVNAGERSNFERSSIFSESMIKAMSRQLDKGQQSLVFLNRRGTARLVSCTDCGWQANCPTCDTPLTYHQDQYRLQCHTCGHQEPVPTFCPVCKSTELRYQRRGTKALQTELEKLFPAAKIVRFDSDNTKSENLASQYQKLASGQMDIIIGTQVIAKGLDLSNLSLVCVPQADLSSYIPDFTADEQTYQLLRQVIGRVGRTNKSSQVIIQSYNPDSPIIKAAKDNDWDSFYAQQIEHRKKYNFPPFTYLLQLTVSRRSSKAAESAAQKLKDSLLKSHSSLEVLGPAPKFHHKAQGKYQWQLIIKSKDRQQLIEAVKQLPSGWRYNLDPSDLL